MARNLRSTALPRGEAAQVSARLAARGVTLAARSINSALNYVRGGRSGQPLRNHATAQALVADPAIQALGICVNDVLDPPVDPEVRVWPGDDEATLAARRAMAAVDAEEAA